MGRLTRRRTKAEIAALFADGRRARELHDALARARERALKACVEWADAWAALDGRRIDRAHDERDRACRALARAQDAVEAKGRK